MLGIRQGTTQTEPLCSGTVACLDSSTKMISAGQGGHRLLKGHTLGTPKTDWGKWVDQGKLLEGSDITGEGVELQYS